jgi:Flp pilus assembly pilin Flp
VRDAFRFIRDEEGQDLIEYSLLASLISITCIVVLQEISEGIVTVFSIIAQAMGNA